jgi:Family of unknown function (DUF5683)
MGKIMNLKMVCLLIISICLLVNAQETAYKNSSLTGSLALDSKILMSDYEQLPIVKMNDDVISPKSPVLAGLLSAAVPGAGQFYNGDYWKTAIFVVIEGALISTALIYNNKGDEQNATFEAYADAFTNPNHNWSVVRYAQWLIDNENADPSIITSTDESLPPWERVNWTALNAAETGSHHLAPHGEQQYYELIGKYPQYSPGWNDFYGGSDYHIVSDNYLYYASQRGKANDYYNIGDKAVLGVIINHAASVVEAILGANSFNKDLSVKFRVDDVQLATQHELIPTLILRYGF